MKQHILMKQEAREKVQIKRWIKKLENLFLFSAVRFTEIVL